MAEIVKQAAVFLPLTMGFISPFSGIMKLFGL